MSWPAARGVANGGASEARGGRPPQVVETWPTGAEVRQVSEFRLASGEPAALVVAGSALHALTWDGRTVFHDACRGVTKVLHVAEVGGAPLALVLSREDRVDVVDLRSGRSGWEYHAPEGTRLSGPGSSRLFHDGAALCWFVAPAYGEAVSCYEIDSVDTVRLRWLRDFGGRYDRGFGPAMIVADALRSGRPQLVISSRTGSNYGADDGSAAVPTEQVVLGRADGHLYQAVLDLDDGEVRCEVAYRPDPGDYPCARPYGLLQVADAGNGERLIVQVSCQVEEFYSVTRVGTSMARAWGEFVEKDWPIDDQELRPQLTSLVERRDSDPVLVVGHFDSSTWRTLVRSASTGATVSTLDGYYFWGTVRSSDGPVAVVSPATSRRLTGAEGLAALRLDGSQRRSPVRGLRPLTCSADELPPEVTFHAERHSLLTLVRDGVVGVLANDHGRVVWWAPADDRTVEVADVDATEGYPGLDDAVVIVAAGALYRITPDLEVTGPVQPSGRRPEVLAATVAGEPWLVSSAAGGSCELRAVGQLWTVDGTAAALTTDSAGSGLLATIADATRVLLWRWSNGQPALIAEITPAGTPTDVRFIRADRMLVTERTGVHTAAAAVYDVSGALVWRDAEHGAHPNLPLAAAAADGRWLVAYDDHGVLLLRDADTGELLAERDWTAAYTTPVLLSAPRGGDALLRVGGVHGMERVDLDLTAQPDERLHERWRNTAALWRYFPGEAAVARVGAALLVGAVSPTGEVDILDAADGRIVHTLPIGAVAVRPPIVAMDVDGDGSEEFVLGTGDGGLVTIWPDRGTTRPWPLSFDAAVEYLAVAADAAGLAELLAGTADGVVHRVRV